MLKAWWACLKKYVTAQSSQLSLSEVVGEQRSLWNLQSTDGLVNASLLWSNITLNETEENI